MKNYRPADLDNHTGLCVYVVCLHECMFHMVCVEMWMMQELIEDLVLGLHTDHVLNFSCSINEFYFLFLKVVACIFVFTFFFFNVTQIPLLDLRSKYF